MGEGTHTSLPHSRRRGQRTWILVAGGTAAAILIAGILFQVFRPTSGQAQERLPTPKAGAAGTATVDGGKSDRYLARVTYGGSSVLISWDEVAHEAMLRYASEVLDNIVNRKIIEQACNAHAIQVSEAEVDTEIQTIAKKFNMTPDQWYTMLQTDRNVTAAQYRRDIIWPMLALKKLAGTEVKVTKGEMQKAFVRDYGPRVKARVIVIDNQRRATEVWEKAQRTPEEFGRLAREFSVDPGSRALDGAIPPVRRYTGNPASEAVEEAAFKLKAGEISAVIQAGEAQWIIMLCEGQTEPVVTDMKEVERELFDRLMEEKTQKKVAEIFEKVKGEARVDNYLSNTTTGSQKPSAAAVPAAPGAVRQVNGQAPATAAPARGAARPAAAPAVPR